MYGRCLKRGRANVTDADAYMRSNIHSFEAYIYGIQQEIPLLLNNNSIPMAMYKNLSLYILAYINRTLPIALELENLKLSVNAYLKADCINSALESTFNYRLEKLAKAQIHSMITASLTVVVKMLLLLNNIAAAIDVGIYNPNSIHYNTKGIRIGVVNLKLVSEIEHLLISDIENLFMTDIVYTRIA